jgi:hypothetical protein
VVPNQAKCRQPLALFVVEKELLDGSSFRGAGVGRLDGPDVLRARPQDRDAPGAERFLRRRHAANIGARPAESNRRSRGGRRVPQPATQGAMERNAGLFVSQMTNGTGVSPGSSSPRPPGVTPVRPLSYARIGEYPVIEIPLSFSNEEVIRYLFRCLWPG